MLLDTEDTREIILEEILVIMVVLWDNEDNDAKMRAS